MPFDGGAPALTAVLGGQVDTACLQIGEAIENIESGKLVPLTVFGPERVEYLPDVPTAQEQGLDVEVAQYRFMTVPKGTPRRRRRTPSPRAMQATFETEEYQNFNEAEQPDADGDPRRRGRGPARGGQGALRRPGRGVRHRPGGVSRPRTVARRLT